MILHEGLPELFARHQRLAAACRAAVDGWGLAIQCADQALYSPVLTGVVMPQGVDADQVRKTIYEHFNMSLGTGLGNIRGRMFRIGHLGMCDDFTLMGTLSACEMGLRIAGLDLRGSGVQAAQEYLLSTSKAKVRYPGRAA